MYISKLRFRLRFFEVVKTTTYVYSVLSCQKLIHPVKIHFLRLRIGINKTLLPVMRNENMFSTRLLHCCSFHMLTYAMMTLRSYVFESIDFEEKIYIRYSEYKFNFMTGCRKKIKIMFYIQFNKW